MADTAADLQQMPDDDLLLQINRFDPYDVEFARRFRAVSAERDRLRKALDEIADQEANHNAVDRCACTPKQMLNEARAIALAALTTKGDTDERT
jgi:hypothetical protein